nr:MAG TPA: hypothetical protein [Caudoviricetes sp.]
MGGFYFTKDKNGDNILVYSFHVRFNYLLTLLPKNSNITKDTYLLGVFFILSIMF